MQLPKILIAAPTSEVKDYCFMEWFDCVKKIDYPQDRMELLLVDNSRGLKYCNYLSYMGIKVIHVDSTGKTPIEFICESHNAIRDYFLMNGFDYLFHLETDVMVKTQTLRTLLFHSEQNKFPVVSACYFKDNSTDTTLIIQQNERDAVGKISQIMNLKSKEVIALINGELIPVWGAGLGATLIRKNVLNKIKFRFEKDMVAYPDSYFYDDCDLNGFPIYADTSLILKHDTYNG